MDLSMDFPITNCRIDCKTKLHDNKPYPVEIKVVLNTGWIIQVNDQTRIDAFAVATDFSATGQFFQSVTKISDVIFFHKPVTYLFFEGRKENNPVFLDFF